MHDAYVAVKRAEIAAADGQELHEHVQALWRHLLTRCWRGC